jgi:hypothetical protein
MKLDKVISNSKLLKLLLVVFSLTFLNNITCAEISLDNIKGSKTKDFSSVEFEIKNAKIVIQDKTLNISAEDASKINSSMQDYVENGTQNIHYGMLTNCSPEVDDSKENSPIILSFKNPDKNSEFYLELGFLPGEPNNVKPRADIVKSINDKCGPIRGAIKEDLLILKEKIAKAASSSKAQNQANEKKKKEEAQSATQGGDKQEIDSLKSKLAELNKKLDQLKKEHSEHSEKSADTQKARLSSSSDTKKMTDDQKATKAKIAEIQKKIEEKMKAKEEISGKKPKPKEEDKQVDKSASDAIRNKTEEKQKAMTKLDLAGEDVAETSKTAQKLQSKVSQAESETKKADQELEKLKNSSTEDEKKKAESDARTAKEKYNANKENLEKTKKTHEQKQTEYKGLIKQKEDFLKSNELKVYEKIKRREDENKKAMKVLGDLEKCFTFREGYVSQLKTSFSNNSVDAINMVMGIRPNKNNYNFVDNIYSSKVPNVCNEIQSAKRRLRKLEKKKFRKDADLEEERKLREQGRTKRNGLIYSAQEEGRLDRVLEYNSTLSDQADN